MKYSFAFTLSLLFQLLFTSTLSAQSWKWAKSSEYKTSLAVGRSYTNPEGITVVAGSYMDSIKIGDTRLVNEGSGKFFIAVFNADGSVSHCFSDGQSFPELEPVAYGMIYGTLMDEDNNIYIAGQGTNPTIFGTQEFTTTDPSNSLSFIAKYSFEGTLLWAKGFSSPGYINSELMHDIVLDEEGNVYCTGFFRSGDLDLTDIILHSHSDQENAYLIKYNVDGEFQWAKTLATENFISSSGYEVSFHDHKIYWTGGFIGDMVLDDQTMESSENGDVFIACLSEDGSVSWLVKSINASIERSMIYKDSLLILGGYAASNTQLFGETLDHDCLFLAAHDLDGNPKWANKIISLDPNNSVFSYGAITALFTDLDQTINVGGMFAGDVLMGETAMSSVNNSPDIFLLKVNADDGAVTQFMSNGTSKIEFPLSVGIDRCGNNYFAGHYVDSTLFGDHKLVNDQSVSLFVAKYATYPECLPLPTAIVASTDAKNVLLYPNPAQQTVSIRFPDTIQEATISIYNDMGKTESIHNYSIEDQSLVVPLSLLPGLYVVKVISADQTYTSKLVIE